MNGLTSNGSMHRQDSFSPKQSSPSSLQTKSNHSINGRRLVAAVAVAVLVALTSWALLMPTSASLSSLVSPDGVQLQVRQLCKFLEPRFNLH